MDSLCDYTEGYNIGITLTLAHEVFLLDVDRRPFQQCQTAPATETILCSWNLHCLLPCRYFALSDTFPDATRCYTVG